MSEPLSREAKKWLSRWAKDEWYVYIRPLTSRFIDRSTKHRLYWAVSVECRRIGGETRYRGEGYDLSEIILKLSEQVPRRKDIQPGYVGQQVTKQNAGFLMADSAVLPDEKVKKIKKKRKEDPEGVIVTKSKKKKRKKD